VTGDPAGKKLHDYEDRHGNVQSGRTARPRCW